jgi:hypothetical protein
MRGGVRPAFGDGVNKGAERAEGYMVWGWYKEGR